MAACAGEWSYHEAAPSQLQSVLTKLDSLSDQKMSDFKHWYTDMLVGSIMNATCVRKLGKISCVLLSVLNLECAAALVGQSTLAS